VLARAGRGISAEPERMAQKKRPSTKLGLKSNREVKKDENQRLDRPPSINRYSA
jgi:hypothetical protein